MEAGGFSLIALANLFSIATYSVDFFLVRSYINGEPSDYKLILCLCFTMINLAANGVVVLSCRDFILYPLSLLTLPIEAT